MYVSTVVDLRKTCNLSVVWIKIYDIYYRQYLSASLSMINAVLLQFFMITLLLSAGELYAFSYSTLLEESIS